MCHHHHHHQRNSPTTDAVQQAKTRSVTSRKKRKQRITTVPLKPARKTRTKRRKPKYLSLNLKLNLQKNPQKSNKKIKMTKKQHQLTLFPLHPENLVEEGKDMHDDNNVVASFLFDTATESTTTLDGLLTNNASEESPLSPPSLTFAYRGRDSCEESDSNGLVRTAMRCKGRDASEERWVSYSEVVEKKIKEEEVSSCVDNDHDADADAGAGAGAWCMEEVQGQGQGQGQKQRLLLALKLDYQEILKAWSDKGPLYIDGESPQTVPDLHDANVPMDAWSNAGNLWSVPEMTSNDGSFEATDEMGGKEGWNREHREASVLRYKEKRQNRLFSKRIRYEVRKLNAEKRPRMKGRFVKRSSSEV